MAPEWLQPLLSAIEAGDVIGPFGGRDRQLPPMPAEVRRAAVLVLFGEGPEGPDVLLIEKGPHLRTHAGQPAFPGGGIEPGEDPAAAALRESTEETGLDPAGVEVLATLPELWVPPSGNAVTPVLAWWRQPSAVRPADLREVAAVARVPVRELVDPANRLQLRSPRGPWVSPAFTVAEMLVWGFTAGVLDRLLALGGWELPWDRSRVEDLPSDLPPVRPDDVLGTPFGAGR